MDKSAITIISGLPRSGTSLMMQMLQAGGMPLLTDGVRKPDADNPRGYWEFEPVKNTGRDPSWLRGARGRAVKMVYRLLYDLPRNHQYNIILMRRDLREILASQEIMLRRTGRHEGGSPGEMATAFESEIRTFDAWIEGCQEFSILRVSYGDLVEHPLRESRHVDRFLGGGLNLAAMAEAVDPSLHRNKRNKG